jgi:hypothetical protein
LEGDFLIDRQVTGGKEQIRVAANHVRAAIGAAGVGAELSNGKIAMLAMKKADGSTGYAVQGQGDVSVTIAGVQMTGAVGIEANTLGSAVSQTMTVGGQNLVLSYDDTAFDPRFNLSNLDMVLEGVIGDALASVADTISDIKTDISPAYDNEGTQVNDNLLAKTLPVINNSVTTMLGLDKLMGVADYTQRYLGTSSEAHILALAAPTYGSSNKPTMRGLLNYLEANWLPTLPGVASGALVLSMGDSGLEIVYHDTLKAGTKIKVDLGEDVAALGLSLDGNLEVNLGVQVEAGFKIAQP